MSKYDLIPTNKLLVYNLNIDDVVMVLLFVFILTCALSISIILPLTTGDSVRKPTPAPTCICDYLSSQCSKF